MSGWWLNFNFTLLYRIALICVDIWFEFHWICAILFYLNSLVSSLKELEKSIYTRTTDMMMMTDCEILWINVIEFQTTILTHRRALSSGFWEVRKKQMFSRRLTALCVKLSQKGELGLQLKLVQTHRGGSEAKIGEKLRAKDKFSSWKNILNIFFPLHTTSHTSCPPEKCTSDFSTSFLVRKHFFPPSSTSPPRARRVAEHSEVFIRSCCCCVFCSSSHFISIRRIILKFSQWAAYGSESWINIKTGKMLLLQTTKCYSAVP